MWLERGLWGLLERDIPEEEPRYQLRRACKDKLHVQVRVKGLQVHVGAHKIQVHMWGPSRVLARIGVQVGGQGGAQLGSQNTTR